MFFPISSCTSGWRTLLRTNFTRIRDLADFLELGEEARARLLVKPRFVLNLPYRLAAKMAKGTLDDPLFRQFVPLEEEGAISADYVSDPVQDYTFLKSEKLLKKYPSRALIISTSACAMHCRYCFRQNFPYETERKGFEAELRQVRNDETIQEIILSGGDPLSLADEVLAPLLHALDEVSHLKRIRFQSRFPIGIPERIDAPFLALLKSLKKQLWFVTHVNHEKELDSDVLAALKYIQRLGIPVMNQAVLLKGVNDSLEALQALAEKLGNNGISFYYLHQLDRVQGASHFEVSPQEGLALIESLQASSSGYLIPRYVAEIPGHPSKNDIYKIKY